MSTASQRQRALARWVDLLQQRFPTLSKPQAKGLALWSIGIVLAKASSLSAVALALAVWLALKPLSILWRLRQWYLEASAKKGHGTSGTGHNCRDWSPRSLCPYLLRWILEDWPNRQLVLALDPTNFDDRVHVLAISVLYRGCAVPVAWTVVEGEKPEAWEPHWERMLGELAEFVPAGWQILVLTDRGLYSPRLFRCLRRLHWHPFLRLNDQGQYRQVGTNKWLNLSDLRLGDGEAVAFEVELFKNKVGRLLCTLACYKGAGHEAPWLIATDLAPELARATWYGLRGWIEQGFKRVKGEGWDLPRTRIKDCARLERLWLAVAVATLWVLEVGGEAEVDEQDKWKEKTQPKKAGEDTPQLPDLGGEAAEQGSTTARTKAAQPKRRWSVFARAWQVLRDALAVGVLLLGSWHPEAWPDHPAAGLPPTPAQAGSPGEVGPRPARSPPSSSIPVIHRSDSG